MFVRFRRDFSACLGSGALTLAVAPIAVVAAATASAAGASSAQHGQAGAARITSLDWPAYLFSVGHSSTTSGPKAITIANAATIVPAWTFTERPPTGKFQPGGGFSASPTVADGMVFIGSQTGDFYALRESTGAMVWSRTLDYEQLGHNGLCQRVYGIVGTATVAPDPVTGALTVYVPGARYLYALDAATGAVRWKALVGPPGSASTQGSYFNWASPTVSGGTVYMGVASNCNRPDVRGGVQSFSQHTGKLLHYFRTGPGNQLSAGVWSSEAVFGGSVWASTGSPVVTGTKLYHAYSILRLSASTLALQGSFQLKLPQAADDDFGSSPTLFGADIGGRRTAMVGACSKDGSYYALRRYALGHGPVWSEVLGAPDGAHHAVCIASAVWNGNDNELYLAGNGIRIAGKTTYGTIREVNPATGAIRWLTRLPCAVMATPALDAATGVLSAVTWAPCLRQRYQAVFLLNAATGKILKTIPQGQAGFAQPVFAGKYLFVADETGKVTAYTP